MTNTYCVYTVLRCSWWCTVDLNTSFIVRHAVKRVAAKSPSTHILPLLSAAPVHFSLCSTTVVCLSQFWSWYLDIPCVTISLHSAHTHTHTHTHIHSANVCSTCYAEIRVFPGDICCNVILVAFNCVNQWVIISTRGGPPPHERSTRGGPPPHKRQQFAPNGYDGTERCQPVVLPAKLSTERVPSHFLKPFLRTTLTL